MYIKNPYVQRFYRLIFLFLCTTGLVLQYATVAGIGNTQLLGSYYSIQSNVLCLLYFGFWMLVQPKKELPLLKGALVLCIVITGLVYHLLLNGAMEAGVGAVAQATPAMLLANKLVHTVVPVLVFFDYFWFTPKGSFKRTDPFLWLLLPLLYVGFIMVRAHRSAALFAGFSGMSRYPYPFVDVDRYGWGLVALMLVVIFAAFLLLGYLLYGLDYLLGSLGKTKAPTK